MQEKIIQQGAEAILIKKGSALIKRRIKKGYRLKEIDEKLRKSRTKREAKLLVKAGKIIPIPEVKNTSEKTKEIEMQFLKGKKLSESLDELKNWKTVCKQIGQNIAKLHNADIIHGDLTTSNMILIDSARAERAKRVSYKQDTRNNSKNSVSNSRAAKVYFIDFGLGFTSSRVEDKAVDIHLIKQALEAKHFKHFEKFFKAILQGYKISKNYKETLKRLEKVEKRGRYKQQY